MLKGGDEPPYHKGEDCWNAIITNEIAENIIKELVYSTKTMKEIATEFNVNYNLIRKINYGESWKNDGYSYPLKNSDERCSICDLNSLNLIFWLLKNSTCSME